MSVLKWLPFAVLALAACSSKYDLPDCHDGYALPLNAPGRPPEIWDDGQSTYVLFPGNLPIPAVYAVEPDDEKKEYLTEATVVPQGEDKILMMHRTAFEWRFRSDKKVICIVNHDWNPAGHNPGTGTTSPDVIRIAR